MRSETVSSKSFSSTVRRCQQCWTPSPPTPAARCRSRMCRQSGTQEAAGKKAAGERSRVVAAYVWLPCDPKGAAPAAALPSSSKAIEEGDRPKPSTRMKLVDFLPAGAGDRQSRGASPACARADGPPDRDAMRPRSERQAWPCRHSLLPLTHAPENSTGRVTACSASSRQSRHPKVHTEYSSRVHCVHRAILLRPGVLTVDATD